jgi:hypothetical protein
MNCKYTASGVEKKLKIIKGSEISGSHGSKCEDDTAFCEKAPVVL